MPFVNIRITTGDETWKAIMNYFVQTFSLVVLIYLINLKILDTYVLASFSSEI